MLILEVHRSAEESADGLHRKLASDAGRRLVGIRQQEQNGRQIVLIHTAQAWDRIANERRQVHVTEDVAFALTMLDRLCDYVRSIMPMGAKDQQNQTNLLAHAGMAKARLSALSAVEMREDHGKWIAVTEAADHARRARRDYGGVVIDLVDSAPAIAGEPIIEAAEIK